MKNVFETFIYILRMIGGVTLALITTVLAMFMTLLTAIGDGLMWLAKKLAGVEDETDENVKEEVTTEE